MYEAYNALRILTWTWSWLYIDCPPPQVVDVESYHPQRKFHLLLLLLVVVLKTQPWCSSLVVPWWWWWGIRKKIGLLGFLVVSSGKKPTNGANKYSSWICLDRHCLIEHHYTVKIWRRRKRKSLFIVEALDWTNVLLFTEERNNDEHIKIMHKVQGYW